MLLKVHCDCWELDHKITENRHVFFQVQTSVAAEPFLGKEYCQQSVIKINYCLGSLPSGGGKTFLNLCISVLSSEELSQSTVFSDSHCFHRILFSQLIIFFIINTFI